MAGNEQIKCNLSTHEAYGSLRDSILAIKRGGIKDPIVKPEIAFQVTLVLFVPLLILQAIMHNWANMFLKFHHIIV